MGPIPSNAPACIKTYRNFRPEKRVSIDDDDERKHSTAPGDARTFVNPTCNSSARLVKLYSKYVCDFCFCFVLFCFASLLLFLGVFLPVIYRRGVRYSRCPSLWLLPLSLFDLIAIPLSLLLHFIPLSLSLLCLPIWAVLHYLY